MDLAETPDQSPNADSNGESGGSSSSWLQILANYATILIAVSAVILSVWEGYEMRQHNRLSVLPNLDVTASWLVLEEGEQVQHGGKPKTITERSHIFKVGIENTGLGPAVFENALLYRAQVDTLLSKTEHEGDGITLRDADSLDRRLRRQFPGMELIWGGFKQGSLMKAGNTSFLYEAIISSSAVPDTLDASPRTRMRQMFNQYSFVVCYCSVYGEDCAHAVMGAEPPSDACGF